MKILFTAFFLTGKPKNSPEMQYCRLLAGARFTDVPNSASHLFVNFITRTGAVAGALLCYGGLDEVTEFGPEVCT